MSKRARTSDGYVKVQGGSYVGKQASSGTHKAVIRAKYPGPRPSSGQKKKKDALKTFDAEVLHMNFASDAASSGITGGMIENTVSTNIHCINQIAQVASSRTRMDRSIHMKALCIRAKFVSNEPGPIGLLLVYDRDDGRPTTPLITDFVTPNTHNYPPSGNDTVTALNAINNTGRYKILKRWDFNMDTNSNGDGVTFGINEYVTFKKPLETTWKADNTDGNYGDMRKGALLLVGLSDMNAAGRALAMTYKTRLYFQD